MDDCGLLNALLLLNHFPGAMTGLVFGFSIELGAGSGTPPPGVSSSAAGLATVRDSERSGRRGEGVDSAGRRAVVVREDCRVRATGNAGRDGGDASLATGRVGLGIAVAMTQ